LVGPPYGAGELVPGTATIRWDNEVGHAVVEVRHGAQSLTTEQVIKGWDGVSNPEGFPTTGRVAHPLGTNITERAFDLPDAPAAMKYQTDNLGAALDPYHGMRNSCVTYCIDVVRAGGNLEIPAGARGAIALRRMIGG
jgi:hypothetical protein